MLDFAISDKVIKISEKVDKPKKLTIGLVVMIRSLFKEEESEEVLPWIKNELLLLNPL